MKKKQGHGKKARTDTPVEELSKKDTIEHYNAIMIEEIRSVVRAELEGMHSRMDSFEGRLESFRNEVNSRFDLVETAIKCNSQAIRELRNDMDRRFSEMSDKMDHVIDRVDVHEERLTRANL
jgi:vacuolar-type H+-ATPase subunit I/STV1